MFSLITRKTNPKFCLFCLRNTSLATLLYRLRTYDYQLGGVDLNTNLVPTKCVQLCETQLLGFVVQSLIYSGVSLRLDVGLFEKWALAEVNVTVSRSSQNLKNDLDKIRSNQQGINKNFKIADEQAKSNYDISTLKTENISLCRELELLLSVVTRMQRKMSIMDKEITGLLSRSMRNNILIHNS